jgi:hypothetical protein
MGWQPTTQCFCYGAVTCCPKFVSSFHVWFRGQDAASEAHHSRNTHVVGHGRWTIWTMNKERIKIKLSKTKGILTFLGSVAFVLVSIWLISFADNQHRHSQTLVKVAGYVGLIFFGLCGLYIFYKLFDTKPGLVIDDKGILDNSSAASGHIIKWNRIVGLRIGQVKSTKFILIDLVDPEQFLNEASGITKTLMWGTY